MNGVRDECVLKEWGACKMNVSALETTVRTRMRTEKQRRCYPVRLIDNLLRAMAGTETLRRRLPVAYEMADEFLVARRRAGSVTVLPEPIANAAANTPRAFALADGAVAGKYVVVADAPVFRRDLLQTNALKSKYDELAERHQYRLDGDDLRRCERDHPERVAELSFGALPLFVLMAAGEGGDGEEYLEGRDTLGKRSGIRVRLTRRDDWVGMHDVGDARRWLSSVHVGQIAQCHFKAGSAVVLLGGDDDDWVSAASDKDGTMPVTKYDKAIAEWRQKIDEHSTAVETLHAMYTDVVDYLHAVVADAATMEAVRAGKNRAPDAIPLAAVPRSAQPPFAEDEHIDIEAVDEPDAKRARVGARTDDSDNDADDEHEEGVDLDDGYYHVTAAGIYPDPAAEVNFGEMTPEDLEFTDDVSSASSAADDVVLTVESQAQLSQALAEIAGMAEQYKTATDQLQRERANVRTALRMMTQVLFHADWSPEQQSAFAERVHNWANIGAPYSTLSALIEDGRTQLTECMSANIIRDRLGGRRRGVKRPRADADGLVSESDYNSDSDA